LDELERLVWKIVKSAAAQFAHSTGTIEVVRNGGWEGEIQAAILRGLGQEEHLLGIVEGRHMDAARIDVVAHPLTEGGPVFALELKTNYAQQKIRVIRKRRLEACNQLLRLLVQQVPCFLVYAVADLWVEGRPDAYVHRHGTVVPNKYKMFQSRPLINQMTMAEVLGQSATSISLPRDTRMTSARVQLYIWLSRVWHNPNGGYTLRPMHEDGTTGDIISVSAAPAAVT
jgi:hypothetical protein